MAGKSSKLAGMRIALVFPDFLEQQLASYQDTARYLGKVPPLSLLYVAGALEAEGATVLVVDCIAANIGVEEAARRVAAWGPDYVGFTLATVDWAGSLRWAQTFKDRLGVPIIVGGIHMECYPAETLTHECIDLGFIGHADAGVADVLVAHHAGRSLDGLPGAVFRRDDGTVQVNEPVPRPRSGDDMPGPARHLTDLDAYFSIVSTEHRYSSAMSNFGCPFGCTFCILRNDKLRQRSALSVVDEMERAHYELGIREMDYFDPVFTMRRDRVHAISEEIIRRGLHKKVAWSVRARPDTVDEDMLAAMWKAGARRIFYGLESGDEALRRRVTKRMCSNERMSQVLRATHDQGFEVLAFVMIGNPGETEQTVAATRDLLLDNPIDLLQISSLFPLPKTPIYQELVARTGRDSWKDHVLHGTPVLPVERLDTDLDDARIRQLTAETYMRFYYRPRFLRFALGRARRPAQLRRGVVAAAGIASSWAQRRSVRS
ncbi:MAG: B12-binding domain-containing radical SAM protein [Alphaproteobacteria bacterium]|nr:B12-binding domain-containing radical SAM protein [Alphaproteobacteria bacterium]